MLYPAQKLVARGELVKVLATDVALIVQLLEREHGAARAQPGLRPSINTLQALHQELDIANPAVIEFDVRAARQFLCRCSAMAAHALARAQRSFDCSKIQLLGVHMRLDA